MASDGTGKIYIPLEDFIKFVAKYGPSGMPADYFVIGPPEIKNEYDQVVFDYAYSTDCHPADWNEEPVAIKKLKAAGIPIT